MWIARREHVAAHGARGDDFDRALHGDDGARPIDKIGRVGAGAGGAVEPRMLVLVVVVGRRDGGPHLVRKCRRVVIARVLVLPVVRLAMRERPAGDGERDEQCENAGGQPGSEEARH